MSLEVLRRFLQSARHVRVDLRQEGRKRSRGVYCVTIKRPLEDGLNFPTNGGMYENLQPHVVVYRLGPIILQDKSFHYRHRLGESGERNMQTIMFKGDEAIHQRNSYTTANYYPTRFPTIFPQISTVPGTR